MNNHFLSNPHNEFSKLDDFDKRLFLEILENHDSIIEIWIKDTCNDYARKGVHINSAEFISELIPFRQFLKSSEQDLNISLENLKNPLDKSGFN